MRTLAQLDGEVGRWLDTYGRDLGRAFEECRRADWLVRIATSLRVDRPVIVAAAAEAASVALKRTRPLDLRPARAVQTALRWAGGECGPADAWAAAFAASQAADDVSSDSPLASEAALAAAAVCFACDPRADDAYYAEKAYAARAVEHAMRAFGLESSVGRQRCLEATRARLTLGVLVSAADRYSLPPTPARP